MREKPATYRRKRHGLPSNEHAIITLANAGGRPKCHSWRVVGCSPFNDRSDHRRTNQFVFRVVENA